jgi:cellulose synthase/poly-beta-1,6-N-acetylglucosamine synthase-like glycosyltransferase
VVLTLLSKIAGRAFREDGAHEPSVSLLVPAYNEQRVIAEKIENALALDYPQDKLEIVVASESDDDTDAIVARYAPRGVRLLTSDVRRGKAANLARAVPSARGEILLFTDANGMFRQDAVRLLVRWFADARVGSVSGRLAYRNPYGTASAYGEELYWDLEMMVKRASSNLGSLPGANGSIFAMRRSLYRPISERRGDDFELPIRVILQGYASLLERDAVSEEAPAGTYLDEYRRKVRIINWMVVSALILLKEAVLAGRWLLAFQLLSHKLNRWAVPFWLLALAPVTLWLVPRSGIFVAAALIQGGLYTLALLGLALHGGGVRPPRLASLALYFITVNAASLMGLLSRAAGREVRWHKRADGLS